MGPTSRSSPTVGTQKLQYARPSPIRMPSSLNRLWWAGLACAAFPYLAFVAVVVASNISAARRYVPTVLLGLVALSLVSAVAAVIMALVFMVKAEAAGLPEPYVAVRRRATGALLLGPIVLLPLAVIALLILGRRGGFD